MHGAQTASWTGAGPGIHYALKQAKPDGYTLLGDGGQGTSMMVAAISISAGPDSMPLEKLPNPLRVLLYAFNLLYPV